MSADGFGDGFEPCGVLSLTTDFGLVDAYVGTMKGVAYGVDPALRIVDLTHTVDAQSVLECAFHVRHAAPYFPAGTVHLAVVDPGVGTARESLVALAGGQAFIAPDNGLLPAALDGYEVRYGVLDAERFLREGASRTFHGRDLYAPAAAALAAGAVSPSEAITRDVGEREIVRIDLPRPIVSDGGARGAVVHIDRFGNALTNLCPDDDEDLAEVVAARPRVVVRGVELGWVETYGDAPEGDVVALVDSFGLVEVARVGGSAEDALGLSPGDIVSLELP